MLTFMAGCDEQPVPSAPPASTLRPPEPPVRPRQEAPSAPSAEANDEQPKGNQSDAPQSAGTPVQPPPAFPRQGNEGGPGRSAPAAPPGAAPSGGTPQQFIVRLSAGVALPQSLPTGTAMGMSVDYVLQGALPTSAVATVWVIESAQGASVEVPVRLNAQGNLMTFVTDMRPEHGPFRSYLAAMFAGGRRTPISPKIDMQSP